MRAFIQERMQLTSSDQQSSSQSILYFGCRKRDADFLYRHDWESCCSELPTDISAYLGAPMGSINDRQIEESIDRDLLTWSKHNTRIALSCAFSRDQTDKIYVTHKIRRHSHVLWQLLEKGAYIFLSGSAKQMPADVKKAFQDVITDCGNKSAEEASSYIQNLEIRGRYITEVWS